MAWIKQGRIFHLDPAPNRSQHAQVPTPMVMEDRIRIFYACRNNGRAFITFFDLCRNDLKTVLYHHEKPIMSLGLPGMFDSDGIMPSCIMPGINKDEIWLFYIGWNGRTEGARYHNEIGIAKSTEDGKTFQRKYDGPIMGRTKDEPMLCVMPFVMHKNSYHMWYQSTTGWHEIDGKYEPVYVIKYAESIDGVNWNRNNVQCVESKNKLEAFSRPTVILRDGKYKMWYCNRGSVDYRGGNGSYRIGYAESDDGIHFERMDDNAGIELGGEGEFDSQMLCYPMVFDVDGKIVMLYNGDHFGQTGIGLAIWG